MPSDKTSSNARDSVLRQFTGRLYRTKPDPLGFRGKTGRSVEDSSRPARTPRWIHFRNLMKGARMGMMDNVQTSENTRRWPRLEVDMPGRVETSKGFSPPVRGGGG